MFLWRWFKRLIFLALFGAALYAASGYVKVHGVPLRTHADRFFKSEMWREGTKDMRTWLASILKMAGSKIEEGITPKEQQELNNIIERDLEAQIKGIKAEGGEEE